MSKIVCHCVGATEADIKKAIRNGNDTIEKLKDTLHVACTCRFCLPEIEEILAKSKKS